MKKTLVVLLILAVAGGVFAQEVSWSGGVTTGALIEMGDNTTNAAGDKVVTIQADDDDVPTGVQARLNAEVVDDNWGLQIGTGADIFNGGQDLYVYNAHGWMDFVDGIIKLRAGLIDPGVWTTAGPEDFNLASGLGIRLEVMPIDGLNVGAFLNYGGGTAAGAMEIKYFFQETTFGFSYSMPDMMGLYIAGALKLDSEADGPDEKEMEAIFGFGINPIEPLSIKVEADITRLGDYSNTGVMWFIEDISYQVMDPLLVGIRLDEIIASEDSALANGIPKTTLGFKPYAEYAINDAVSVGAEIPVTMADIDGIKLADLGAKVWAKYTQGGAWVQGSYAFTSTTKDASATGSSTLDHTIRVVFGYSF